MAGRPKYDAVTLAHARVRDATIRCVVLLDFEDDGVWLGFDDADVRLEQAELRVEPPAWSGGWLARALKAASLRVARLALRVLEHYAMDYAERVINIELEKYRTRLLLWSDTHESVAAAIDRVNAAVEKAMAATATAAPPPPGDSEFARQASC